MEVCWWYIQGVQQGGKLIKVLSIPAYFDFFYRKLTYIQGKRSVEIVGTQIQAAKLGMHKGLECWSVVQLQEEGVWNGSFQGIEGHRIGGSQVEVVGNHEVEPGQKRRLVGPQLGPVL